MSAKDAEIDLLARTLFGEARGEIAREGRRAYEAVAQVILNRVAARRWPNDIKGVILQALQFSVWNARDPNRPKMLAVTARDREFKLALEVARAAVEGTLPNHVGKSDHYHTRRVNPSWSRGKTPVVVIGNHKFFHLG